MNEEVSSTTRCVVLEAAALVWLSTPMAMQIRPWLQE